MSRDALRDAADRAADLLDAATPGPWTGEWVSLTAPGMEDCGNYQVFGDKHFVAALSDDDEAEADTALIAAAPDLLAVLGPAARQLADAQDENERLERELQASEVRSQANYNFAARYRRERNDTQDEVQRLRTVLDGLGDPATIRVMADNLTGIGWTPEAEVMHAAADAVAAARGEGT